MTALALALVACCAMVCGTRLILRGYDIREKEAKAAILGFEGLTQKVESLNEWGKDMETKVQALRKDVSALQQDRAFRSIG